MKTLLVITAAAGALLAWSGNAPAQSRSQGGGFETQMRQRMLQKMREQFEVKDDSEWKAIADRLTKIMELRRSLMAFGGGAGFGGPPGPPPSGGRQPQGPPDGGPDAGPGGPPGGSGGPPGMMVSSPELDALRKAIESKASAEELKKLLANVRAARANKEAELEKAQQDLRQLLSLRQEAIAVAAGMLK